MKPIPKTVQVGGVDYSIDFRKDLRGSDGTKLDGSIDYAPFEILLDSELGIQGNYVTLWHEIVHAILEHAGRDIPDEVIDTMAHGIVQVIRDNPELCAT